MKRKEVDRMREDDEKYMLQAIKEAKKAEALNEVPIGAVIVCDGEVVGAGHNMREKMHSAVSHAEINAIQVANNILKSWRLEDCTLYVTLEPCPMCAGAIIQSRIKRVVYGASDPKAGCAGTLMNLLEDERFNHQVAWEKGVLEAECATILSDFFKKLRQKKR